MDFNKFLNNEFMFKIGAILEILAASVLIYSSIEDIYNHIIVKISIFLFSLIKVIGKFLEIPYCISNANNEKFDLVKNLILIVQYIVVLLIHILF